MLVVIEVKLVEESESDKEVKKKFVKSEFNMFVFKLGEKDVNV